MFNLYENGNLVSEVDQIRFIEGKRQVHNTPIMGGTVRTKGRKQPDEVTFITSVSPSIDGVHELVDDDGNKMIITITSINTFNKGFIISAYVIKKIDVHE